MEVSVIRIAIQSPFKKSKKRTRENTIILPYSPIKIRAKSAPKYSTLNPETSSLSPSLKSNGARFNSATRVMKRSMNMPRFRRRVSILVSLDVSSVKRNLFEGQKIAKIISESLIS